jgi:hypothetical protein
VRNLTIQIDIDALSRGLSEVERGVNQAIARMQLSGIPLVDGIAHTLTGEHGQHIGHWSVEPKDIS